MARRFESVHREFESLRPSLTTLPRGGSVFSEPRIITPVVWLEAPEWLTVDEACWLSGHDRDAMLQIIEIGGVDAEQDAGAWLIERESLYEFQESLAEVLHWEHDEHQAGGN